MVNQKAPASRRRKRPAPEPEKRGAPAEYITTAIHIPMEIWQLLRAAAFHKAQQRGGRVSVSKLIAELVERHRSELERLSK
jgi:hypothetical protein